MEYGAEVRIQKNADTEQIAHRKDYALHLLARQANVPVETIDTSRLRESRREDPSGDWFYQVRIDIRAQNTADRLFYDLDDLRNWAD